MTAIVLLTIGALNAALALTVETCTQGAADSLGGGAITLFFYLAGATAMLISPPPRFALLILLPAGSIAVWHTFFALHFAWGFWMHDMSACFAMMGGFSPKEAGEWMDGREPALTYLWMALSLAFWVALWLGLRTRRSAPNEP